MGTPDEPDLHFVGRVGQFTPVTEGVGGGILVRSNTAGDKYSAVTGTKGYLWMESETLRQLPKEVALSYVDRNYYRVLVDKALDAIGKYGDPDEFCDGVDNYPWMDDSNPF
jgi:hypothetical protein